MLITYRSHSILTVHFKNSLLLAANFHRTLYKTRKSSTKKDDQLSRVGASMEISDPPHFTNPYYIQSFYSNSLKLCAKKGFLAHGKQLHASMIKFGFFHNVLWLQNQILNLYIKCKQVDAASKVFDEIHVRNVVTWNTMISGLVGCGRIFCDLGFCYFTRMLIGRLVPDSTTFTGLLKLCIEVNDIEIGRQLNSLVIKVGLSKDCFVGSVLVDLYAKFGEVEDARKVFDFCLDRDLVLWNVMVSCYTLNGLGGEAFRVFKLMDLNGVKGDDFTFTSLINACSSWGPRELGRLIHGVVLKNGFDMDVVIASAVVDMYVKNDVMYDARKVFQAMKFKNLISWTTLIVGYGRHGDGKEATMLLVQMLGEGFNPDELTLASVLSSCGNLSLSGEIVQIHAYAIKTAISAFLSVGNALINAYSKSGNIASAFLSFNLIIEPDLVSWTSMIGACAFHGLSGAGIQLFEKMLSHKIRPDRVAFLEVLSACCHGGLVCEGFHYFELMTDAYEVVPDLDHYTCLIDLLGRGGLLIEAFNVLLSMPIQPGSDTLGAFIGACKVYGNVDLAQWAVEQLVTLEPHMSVNYTLMSNLYASAECWNDVSRVRKIMRDNCHYKVPGCSWIEIAGQVHTFISSDKIHPQILETNATLVLLFSLMKDKEGVPCVDLLH
ncbi:pentatricopeptide repeat-containing protein At2g46050, mitochondrial [Apium graveolens]|uniref:pentatricopeptide repeat-containing protein At2g46050, mitochondrial n=1 Tax=Apium graveolens TaxID=4045 RepID=UPI003D79E143